MTQTSKIRKTVYISAGACDVIERFARGEDRTFTHVASRILEKAASRLLSKRVPSTRKRGVGHETRKS